MSEKFSVKELTNDRSWVSNCVMHCLGDLLVDDKTLMEEIKEAKSADICLTINGREVSLKSYMESLGEYHKKSVQKGALELMEGKFSDFQNTLQDLERNLKNEFYKQFPDMERER